MKYKLVNIEDGSTTEWDIKQILDMINSNHSDEWTDYNESDDINEALEHWTDWRIVK